MTQTCPDTTRKNPVKAIRLKCLDCSGGSPSEVTQCKITDCALYPFRLGKNPFRTKPELSEEELEKRTARLRKFTASRQKAQELDA